MIRYFLAKGDRAGNAVIIDGLESVTCANPPPCVEIATLYMQTYCSACHQRGFISPRGPRWPGTGPNGKEWALSGDVNICGCNPPPVFYAERDMRMTFTADQAAKLAGKPFAPLAMKQPPGIYNEQFILRDASGSVLADVYYTVRLPSGELRHGLTDSLGKTDRHETDGSHSIHFYLGHRQRI